MKEHNQLIGVMSGFDSYSTTDVIPSTNKSIAKYTLASLLEELRELKESISKKELDDLRSLIDDHIHDKSNPHGTTLVTMGTDIIGHLYKTWLERGNEGTREKFISCLFSYIDVADVAEVRDKASYYKAITLKAVKFLFEEHNQDPLAHSKLLEAMFPGTPIECIPSWACIAGVGTDKNLIVKRPSEQYYHRSDGYLDKVGENELAVDYIHGTPMFSIWETRENKIPHCAEIQSFTTIGGSTDRTELHPSLFYRKHTAIYVENISATDSSTGIQVEEKHGYLTPPLDVDTDNWYTYSVYVKSIKREYASIIIPTGIADVEEVYATYALVEQEDRKSTTVHMCKQLDNVYAYSSFFHNGWVRLVLVFKPIIVRDNLRIETVFNTKMTTPPYYPGNSKKCGMVTLMQFEKGVNASPIIITDAIPRVRAKTEVMAPIRDMFNRDEGTLVIEAFNEYAFCKKNGCLYNVGHYDSDSTKITNTLKAQYKEHTVADGCIKPAVKMVAYATKDNAPIADTTPVAMEAGIDTVVQGYSGSRHYYTGNVMVPDGTDVRLDSTIQSINTSSTTMTFAELIDKAIGIIESKEEYLTSTADESPARNTHLIGFNYELEYSLFKDLGKIPTDELLANDQLLNYFIIKKGATGNVASIYYETFVNITKTGIDSLMNKYHDVKLHLDKTNFSKEGSKEIGDEIIYSYSFLGNTRRMDTLILNDTTDMIAIGCSLLGNEQYNGYIRSLVYYPKLGTVPELEFIKGEKCRVEYKNIG